MSAPITNDKMDRSFLDASIPDLIKELTTNEKISLLAGQNWWATVAVPRLNIPSINMTDGPGGARGHSFFNMGGYQHSVNKSTADPSSRFCTPQSHRDGRDVR